ncbi:MAG: hypothetical protein ABL907_12895, partial [Hyphomicrobium sp.]
MTEINRASWLGDVNAFQKTIGNIEFRFDRAHVVSTETYNKFDFVKAMDRTGLFVQNDFSQNGVHLVSEYRDPASGLWKNINDAPDAVRSLVSGASHTGGHYWYNSAQIEFFEPFEKAYNTARTSFGATNPNAPFEGSLQERAFLESHQTTINKYTNVLKVEFVNPESALKNHSTDTARIDFNSKQIWDGSPDLMRDPITLELKPEFAAHKAAQISTPIDGSIGSGSVLDRNLYAAPSDVAGALDTQHGIKASDATLVHKSGMQSMWKIASHAGLVVGGAALLLAYSGIEKQAALMAAELGRPVGFEEAAQALGIEANRETFVNLGAQMGVELGATAVVPWVAAKRAVQLLLDGEAAVDLLKAGAQLYKGEPAWDAAGEWAQQVEKTPGYESYKGFADWTRSAAGAIANGVITAGTVALRVGEDFLKSEGIDLYARFKTSSRVDGTETNTTPITESDGRRATFYDIQLENGDWVRDYVDDVSGQVYKTALLGQGTAGQVGIELAIVELRAGTGPKLTVTPLEGESKIYRFDEQDRLTSASLLDADGFEIDETRIARDGSGDSTQVLSGQGAIGFTLLNGTSATDLEQAKLAGLSVTDADKLTVNRGSDDLITEATIERNDGSSVSRDYDEPDYGEEGNTGASAYAAYTETVRNQQDQIIEQARIAIIPNEMDGYDTVKTTTTTPLDPDSWNTTVTAAPSAASTPRPVGMTDEQAEALRRQAIQIAADREAAKWEQDSILSGKSIGSAFGSALGNVIGGDNVFARIGASTVLGATLGTLGAGFGQYVGQASGNITLDAALDTAFNNYSANLGAAFQSAAVGAVSSFLVGELAESLGFDGRSFGDQLLRASVGGLTNTVLNNAATLAFGTPPSGMTLFSGLDGVGAIATNIAGSLSGFVGGYLAHQIVTPNSIAGSIGGSLGGALGGAIAGSAVVIGAVSSALVSSVSTLVLSAITNFILPGLGVFLGTIAGTLVGNVLNSFTGDEGFGEYTTEIQPGHAGFTGFGGMDDIDFGAAPLALRDATQDYLNKIAAQVGGTSNKWIQVEFHADRKIGVMSGTVDTVWAKVRELEWLPVAHTAYYPGWSGGWENGGPLPGAFQQNDGSWVIAYDVYVDEWVPVNEVLNRSRDANAVVAWAAINALKRHDFVGGDRFIKAASAGSTTADLSYFSRPLAAA